MEHENISCGICGSPWHYTKNCPERAAQEHDNIDAYRRATQAEQERLGREEDQASDSIDQQADEHHDSI